MKDKPKFTGKKLYQVKPKDCQLADYPGISIDCIRLFLTKEKVDEYKKAGHDVRLHKDILNARNNT